jgi:hypothetical protein
MIELESINFMEEDLFLELKNHFNILFNYLKINGDKIYIWTHIKNKIILIN